jgi:two-component system, cell cycle response regulator
VSFAADRNLLGSDSTDTLLGFNSPADQLLRPQPTNSDTSVGVAQRTNLETAKACLVKIHPAVLGEGLIDLPDHRYMIGRSSECHLTLGEDQAVSRQHAYVERRPDGFVVVDLGSTNGTYVNDEPINDRKLATGDLIRIGSHIFKYLSNDVEAQYHQTIFSMIVTDGLTGVFSRRFFEEALEREVVRSQRHRRPLSLVLFDIDRFKSVNDEHSHLVGNEVLREVCRRVAPSIRRDEVFARWGGEEFAVLLPESKREQAAAFAERVRKLVSGAPIVVGAIAIPVTISLGVGTMSGEPGMDGHALVLEADRNLLRAKAAGRNCLKA